MRYPTDRSSASAAWRTSSANSLGTPEPITVRVLSVVTSPPTGAKTVVTFTVSGRRPVAESLCYGSRPMCYGLHPPSGTPPAIRLLLTRAAVIALPRRGLNGTPQPVHLISERL